MDFDTSLQVSHSLESNILPLHCQILNNLDLSTSL